MAAVPTYNMTWQQGEDGWLSFTYKSGNPPAPVDLTGYKLRMDIRNATGTLLYIFNSDDLPTELLDIVGGADNEATLTADGLINILVPRAATVATGGPLTSEVGKVLNYDIMLRDPAGRQKKILRGNISLEASSTLWI